MAAAPRLTPRLGITAKAATVKPGTAARLTTKLVHPKTGKPIKSGNVRLQLWHKGAWRVVLSKQVTSAGTAVFRPTLKSTTRFRANYTGSSTMRGVVTKGITISTQSSGDKVIAEAKKHRGKAYRFGASGPNNFDCSGFTMYVYRKALGKKLPHKAHTQQKYGTAISKSKARPGDLIIIRSGSYGTHAGIYAGDGYIWASPRSGKNVGKQKIWNRSYVVRRLA
jgi:cell wall-associated NlpC family hydrolase